jgi:hypothetical protein
MRKVVTKELIEHILLSNEEMYVKIQNHTIDKRTGRVYQRATSVIIRCSLGDLENVLLSKKKRELNKIIKSSQKQSL